jgi:protease I
MATKGKAKLRAVILTADKFEDMELFFPYFRLMEEGVHVDIAVPVAGQIRGEHGYSMQVDLTFDKVDPAKYDLLIIPGGFPDGAPLTVSRSPRAQEITRHFFEKNKPVAVICHGPYTLVSAGVVKGRKLTSFWHDGVPEQIKKAGGIWQDAEVVVDGNLVTSRWPPDLPAFMAEMMKLLRAYKKK